jgi:hypothetical protein
LRGERVGPSFYALAIATNLVVARSLRLNRYARERRLGDAVVIDLIFANGTTSAGSILFRLPDVL